MAKRKTSTPRRTSTRKSTASRSGGSGARGNTGMAIIAYIIFFIPLLTGDAKKSAFVRFHTNQGTVLFLFCVALAIASGIIWAILGALFLWRIWGILSIISWVVWIGVMILYILGIINAANGKMNRLPLIGGFTIIK